MPHTAPEGQQSAKSAQPSSQPGGEFASVAQSDLTLRRYFDPGRLQPRDVLALQHLVGNQVVQRLLDSRVPDRRPSSAPLIQPKLTVGPVRDRYEEEADRIARQVLQGPVPPAPPKVRRKENRDAAPMGLGGGPLDAALERDITQARGSGYTLDKSVRRTFEERLGRDFQDVRVHTDNRADRLNRSLSARAFTTGHDIFFKQGEYRPHSGAGQQLLAHELTHVVQQTGAPSVQRWSWSWPWSKKKKDDTGKQENTGKPENKNKKGATAWTKNPYNPLIAKAMPGSTEAVDPKKLAQAQESAGSLGVAIPDYADPDLASMPTDRYVVTIAVSQEETDWWEKIKKLKTIGLKTLFKSPIELFSRIKAGDWEQYLLGKMLQTDDAAVLTKATNDFHSVGHTWVRLTAYAGTRVKQHYSYGFWPRKIGDQGGYQMNKYVPGQVRHPDTVHEEDATKRYYDKTITGEQFQNALSLAQQRYASPPAYHVLDYNCTKFAREVVQAAGRAYPGSGVFPSIGYSPGQLFSAIGGRMDKNKKGKTGKTAYADDPLSAIVKSVKTGVEAREGQWKTKQLGKTPQDPNAYPEGIYEIPITKDITLQASLTRDGALDTEFSLAASDGTVEVYVEDDITRTFGRAYVKQSGKTYFFPMDQLLKPGMIPTDDLPDESQDAEPPVPGKPYVATAEMNISDQPPIHNSQIFENENFHVLDADYPGNIKDWATEWVDIWWGSNKFYVIADDLRNKAKPTTTQNAPVNDTQESSTTNATPVKSVDLEKVIDPTALAFLEVGNWEGAALDLGDAIFKLNEDELDALAEFMKITRKELDKQIAEYKKTIKP